MSQLESLVHARSGRREMSRHAVEAPSKRAFFENADSASQNVTETNQLSKGRDRVRRWPRNSRRVWITPAWFSAIPYALAHLQLGRAFVSKSSRAW